MYVFISCFIEGIEYQKSHPIWHEMTNIVHQIITRPAFQSNMQIKEIHCFHQNAIVYLLSSVVDYNGVPVCSWIAHCCNDIVPHGVSARVNMGVHAEWQNSEIPETSII
jgi:hypothetical protein